jgi:hypothetical protein
MQLLQIEVHSEVAAVPFTAVPQCLLMLQVCGITNAADAQYAVQQGADLIGE